jgi:ribosomal protein S24E
MKKQYIATIIGLILLACVICYYAASYGIQTVSTDKKVYSSSEEVKVHWTDFRLERCTSNNKGVVIFKQETTGWKEVRHQLYGAPGANFYCVNNEITGVPMHADIIYHCSSPFKLKRDSGNFSWNSKIYEYKGKVTSCLDPFNNEAINKTWYSYEFKDAPSGKYKITHGLAQTIIEIR